MDLLTVQIGGGGARFFAPLSPLTLPSPGSTKQTEAFFTHSASHHLSDAFMAMNRMRHQGLLCDITLRVGKKEIIAHKLVLASCSPYFHAMFTADMQESHQSEVRLHDISSDAVEQLVMFAYTSEITIGERNVQELLPAASVLQLNSVRDACCKFLLGQLDPSNCLGIRRFADTHGCFALEQCSQQFVLQNFNLVVRSEEFLQLPVEEVEALVSNEQLNIISEEDVFSAIMLWVQYDENNRTDFIAKLLKHVRLALLQREFLVNRVERNNLVHKCNECKDMLILAMRYHLLPEQRGSMVSTQTQLRQPVGLVPRLFSIGGGSLFAIHNECEMYDLHSDTWIAIQPMNVRRARLGVAALYRIIYAVGGYDGINDLSSVECYNPQTNTWKDVASMGTRRSCVGIAILDGLLYAVGGYDGGSCVDTVERYDPLTNQWCAIAAMNARRRYAKVAAVGGYLYAIGGYDGTAHLSSVERYDPKTNKWISVCDMLSQRSSMGVSVIEDRIYVTGGNDGATCLNSAECYNPEMNIWESLPSMTVRRSTHDATSMNGMIYVIGGNDGSSSLNSVERYEPATRKWSTISNMVTRRSSVGATASDVLMHRISIPTKLFV
ncbi:kelch-like protein 17 [Amphiura filiformis]|uniref:kelch-like protein 17 n=1 Tax=Amphiura filiformis TaxID=82378 RepID=UPI003B223F8F